MTVNVKKFAVNNMTTITERKFKSEFLFRTCSVAANLMTLLEFYPICYVVSIWPTWSSYVAILFILRGNTATSSATGDQLAVPERVGQNEEPASRNEERTRKSLVFFQKKIETRQ